MFQKCIYDALQTILRMDFIDWFSLRNLYFINFLKCHFRIFQNYVTAYFFWTHLCSLVYCVTCLTVQDILTASYLQRPTLVYNKLFSEKVQNKRTILYFSDNQKQKTADTEAFYEENTTEHLTKVRPKRDYFLSIVTMCKEQHMLSGPDRQPNACSILNVM